MRAFVKVSSSSDDIRLMDVLIPEIGEHELLVKIHAIGVGVHDEYYLPQDITYPYVVGIEASGVIEQVGRAVTKYQSGQRVTFVSAMQSKGGTWAEYAVVSDSSLILPIPNDMSFERAAALPVAGNTILKAFRALDLQPGDSIFIAGGSGAIGTLGIQIAKARGYRIAASASAGNHEYMRVLGAELTVDYRDDNWQQVVKDWQPSGVKSAIATQPNTAEQCQLFMKDGGVIVPISGDQFTPERDIELRQLPYAIDVTLELTALTNQIDAGNYTVTIEKTYPFEHALLALEKAKTRHSRGKLIVSLNRD